MQARMLIAIARLLCGDAPIGETSYLATMSLGSRGLDLGR